MVAGAAQVVGQANVDQRGAGAGTAGRMAWVAIILLGGKAGSGGGGILGGVNPSRGDVGDGQGEAAQSGGVGGWAVEGENGDGGVGEHEDGVQIMAGDQVGGFGDGDSRFGGGGAGGGRAGKDLADESESVDGGDGGGGAWQRHRKTDRGALGQYDIFFTGSGTSGIEYR